MHNKENSATTVELVGLIAMWYKMQFDFIVNVCLFFKLQHEKKKGSFVFTVTNIGVWINLNMRTAQKET